MRACNTRERALLVTIARGGAFEDCRGKVVSMYLGVIRNAPIVTPFSR